MELLLTVVDAFEIKGRGVVVLPAVPVSSLNGPALPKEAHLRFENGSMKAVRVHFDIPRVSPPPEPGQYSFLCLIKGVSKTEVPAGTQVWLEQ